MTWPAWGASGAAGGCTWGSSSCGSVQQRHSGLALANLGGAQTTAWGSVLSTQPAGLYRIAASCPHLILWGSCCQPASHRIFQVMLHDHTCVMSGSNVCASACHCAGGASESKPAGVCWQHGRVWWRTGRPAAPMQCWQCAVCSSCACGSACWGGRGCTGGDSPHAGCTTTRQPTACCRCCAMQMPSICQQSSEGVDAPILCQGWKLTRCTTAFGDVLPALSGRICHVDQPWPAPSAGAAERRGRLCAPQAAAPAVAGPHAGDEGGAGGCLVRMESCCHSALAGSAEGASCHGRGSHKRHYLFVPSTVPSCILLYGHLCKPGPN